MTTLITVWQTTSILAVGVKTTTKITVIRTRETVSIVTRATAIVATVTIAVPKKTTSIVETLTARPGRQDLLSEIVW